MLILDLSAAVDVYSDWIDACDSVAKEAAHGQVDADGLHSNPGLAFDENQRGLDMDFGNQAAVAAENIDYGVGDYADVDR